MIGHTHILNFFNTAMTAGNMSHAYLLVGPAHVGKRTLARTLTAQLVETSVETLEVHPDVRILRQEKNEKTGKLKKDISIEQVRAIRPFAAAGPVRAPHSVIIIEQAERLSSSAANALLKTLEEPHPQTVILMTGTDIDRIPATIRSRAQELFLAPVPMETLIAVCADLGDPATVTLAAELAAGLPGIAYTYLTESDTRERLTAARDEFHALFHAPLYQKRQHIEHLFAQKEDHILGRAAVLERIRIWSILLRAMLRQGTFSGTPPQAVRLYDTLQQTASLLQQNVHPRAAMDALLLSIP